MIVTVSKVNVGEKFTTLHLVGSIPTSLGNHRTTLFFKVEETDLEEGAEVELDMNDYVVTPNTFVDEEGITRTSKWLEPKL